MDTPAKIVYQAKRSCLKIPLFVLAIALTPLAPYLWITNHHDPAAFAVVGLVIGTLLFFDLVIDLGVPIARRQIDDDLFEQHPPRRQPLRIL